MKVLLINSPSPQRPIARDMAGGLGFGEAGGVLLPPLELAYMASALLAKGHDVRIVDADAQGFDAHKIRETALEYGPDVLIATVSLPTLYADIAFIQSMRDVCPERIFAKTNIAEPALIKEILDSGRLNKVIIGECELIIDKIIFGNETANTAYLEEGVVRFGQKRYTEDLNCLAYPARQLLNNAKYNYHLLGEGITTMQTSRGCPFACAYYCPYPSVQGDRWRYRSPGNVIGEIKDIVHAHGIKKILMRDATFTLDKKRARDICELIIRDKIEIEWWSETRINCLDEELMRLMRRAGCRGINIGAETGDPELFKETAKQQADFSDLQRLRKEASKIGMHMHFLFMLGLPGDDKGSIYKTFKFILKLKPDSIGVCILTPYPGTALYEEAKKKGWIETYDWSKYGGHSPVMHTDSLSALELKEASALLYKADSLAGEHSIAGYFKLMLLRGYAFLWTRK